MGEEGVIKASLCIGGFDEKRKWRLFNLYFNKIYG